MKRKDVGTRLWLDQEIRDLIGFSFEQFGKKGVKYTASEIRKVAKSLLKGELKAK